MKKTWFTLAVALISLGLKGQMFPLSEDWVFNPLMVNPAYCGTPGALSASFSYRNQWAGMESAPKNQVMTLQAPVHHDRIGLGLVVDHQSIGIFRETGLFGNYAYRRELAHGKIALGMAFGVTLIQSHWDELVAADPDDAEIPMEPNSYLLPNFSLGAWYVSDRYFFGISLPRFLGHTEDPSSGRPVITANPREFNVLVTGGTTLNMGNGLSLSPSALLKAIPDHGLQADFLLLAGWHDLFHGGLGYRTGNTMIGMMDIRINPQFNLLYSYDFTLSRSTRLRNGSHEFSLRYTFSYIHKVTNPRQF